MAMATPIPIPTTTTTQQPRKMTVWDLGEETMAHAMLIFMLADLRFLSATGQIRTKYEYLCLDSDKSPRHTSMDFAGFHQYQDTCGVTAAHIMAVLMLEISREAADVSESNQESTLLGSTFNNNGGGGHKRRPFEFGRKDVQKASGMPALLHCYNTMVAQDIASETHEIRKREFPVKMDTVEEDHRKKRADFNPNVQDDDNESLFPGRHGMLLQRSKSIRNLVPARLQPQKSQRRTSINAVLHTIAAVNSLLISHVTAGEDDCYNQEEVIMLMEQAIATRDKSQLAFMKNFFKEGSISRVLVESKAEMVWLSDWHTTHECTYAISIDREEKKVLLAFRGAYTFTDWTHALDTAETKTSNPIREDYPNRPKNIRVHGGFHKYLFRVRKDTDTTKYDEIAAKVAHYCNVVGEGVTLTITGHSLGAALATVFSLYASTEKRFTQNGAIETVTFGAPYVAGFKFADAVRHQESCGKLRIAKFRCSNDGVTKLPPTLLSMSKRGAKYFHSGMDISLPGVQKCIFKLYKQRKPEVVYQGQTKGFLRELFRQARDYYFWNIPLRFWIAVKMHTLVEHKLRMAVLDHEEEDSILVQYSLEELYAMRDDLSNMTRQQRRGKK